MHDRSVVLTLVLSYSSFLAFMAAFLVMHMQLSSAALQGVIIENLLVYSLVMMPVNVPALLALTAVSRKVSNQLWIDLLIVFMSIVACVGLSRGILMFIASLSAGIGLGNLALSVGIILTLIEKQYASRNEENEAVN